ncbi:glycogen debranching N-terminal domain-containing protein [Gryllotalpicola daejeonensis]|uniref:Glycogen debranching N-terminal domain-containing protein n=1 Tax=Gryllotalpicola daejeonensis TaxID=993087 RepID=A0ABP7ZK91_9MICO
MSDFRPQPLLHDAHVVLRAPTQAWSDSTGDMGAEAVHGLYHSNTRVIDTLSFSVEGHSLEPLRELDDTAMSTTFTTVLRGLPGERADPRFRVERTRVVDAGRMSEEIVFNSALPDAVRLTAVLRLHADFTPIHLVKDGLRNEQPVPGTTGGGRGGSDGDGGPAFASWSDDGVTLRVTAPGAVLTHSDGELEFRWPVEVPAGGAPRIAWWAELDDERAVVQAVTDDPGWDADAVPAYDLRIRRWVQHALTDLVALRVTLRDHDEPFLAAGAPWFFTLFGRDSLWAAHFMLPLDQRLAMSTLRALSQLQGTKVDPLTAEQPGKIMHELRPAMLELAQQSIVLPPLYYGTIDATPLWITLLRDAWHAGASGVEVKALLPNLAMALAWMRDYGMSDDGFLRYADESGRGLSNQGWKDSDDSIQWRDGRLAEGPIALCEVQGYAYAAAMAGAELLESFGEPGAEEWRSWAAALRQRFNDAFWVSSPDGDYPAIALDAHGQKVDSVASNMGHLLGTGILDHEGAALVARRLLSSEMRSGFGLRTMSTAESGYWPMAYHGGSVWAHDTAIAVLGLAREGFHGEARVLADELVSAAVQLDFRMPELHAGDERRGTETPVPYPAACRPQAWSAAAAIAIAFAVR